MSAHTTLRKFGKTAAVVGITAIILVTSFIIVNRFFQIQDIEVVGSDVQISVNKDQIPKSLIFFPTNLIEKQMELDNPQIDSITIKKKYPHTLVIVITARKPMALVKTPTNIYSVDAKGYVIGEGVALTNIPVIEFDTKPVPIGQKITDVGVLSAISFLDTATPILVVYTLKQFDSTSFLAKTDKADILFPQQQDMRSVAATLQTLLTGFRIKGTLPTRIDLRFEKPIVTF